MALNDLEKVTAATLLLVGGWDQQVIKLNRQAYSKLKCTRKLEIIPEATHLFEEPGKLDQVALLSTKWFVKWFKNKNENV